MYRRIGWTLVNLKQVLKIEASGNLIIYTLPVNQGSMIFMSGGVSPERLLEIYKNDQDCAAAFQELSKSLTQEERKLH